MKDAGSMRGTLSYMFMCVLLAMLSLMVMYVFFVSMHVPFMSIHVCLGVLSSVARCGLPGALPFMSICVFASRSMCLSTCVFTTMCVLLPTQTFPPLVGPSTTTPDSEISTFIISDYTCPVTTTSLVTCMLSILRTEFLQPVTHPLNSHTQQ